jgi:hypothetical protein
MPHDLMHRWLNETLFRFWPARQRERCGDVVAATMGYRGKCDDFALIGPYPEEEVGYVVYDERRGIVYHLSRPGVGEAELSRSSLAELARDYATGDRQGTPVEEIALQYLDFFKIPVPEPLRAEWERREAARKSPGRKRAQAEGAEVARTPRPAGGRSGDGLWSHSDIMAAWKDPLTPELREMVRADPIAAVRCLVEHEADQSIARHLYAELAARTYDHERCHHDTIHRVWADYHEESREWLFHEVCTTCAKTREEWSDE